MQAEMEVHLEGLMERNLAAGMSAEEARYAARRDFGGVEQIKERARDERRSVWLEQAGQDLRYALRSLGKTPSFTITAIVTLALGIGVNAALFSLYNKVALQPLPLKEPESLVRIRGATAQGRSVSGFSFAEYRAYRDGSHALAGLLAFREARWALQSRPGAARETLFDVGGLGAVPVELVSDNYFDVLGGAIQLGRAFLPDEVRAPGGAAVIVLSDAFWGSHFQRDPNVIGARLNLGEHTCTVIGVAAAEFPGQGPVPPAGWVPLTLGSRDPNDYGPRGPEGFDLVGRLKMGVTDEQARADLDALASRRAVEFPGEQAKVALRVSREMRYLNIPKTPQALGALSPLLLGFGMVLFIACTNVANLLLTRGVARQAEIAVRLTLGASRGRIVRQLLTETSLLGFAGATLGLGLGLGLLRVLQKVILAPLLAGVWIDFMKPTVDLRVLAFTATLGLGATIVAGLLPALHAARVNLIATVHGEGTALGRRLTPTRLRQILVVAQVALSLSLLSCAGVLARNFFKLKRVDVGFDAEAVYLANVTPNATIQNPEAAFRQALTTLQTLPQINAVAAAGSWSFFGRGQLGRIRATEAAASGGELGVRATFVTPGFFETFGMPLRRGRTFFELELQSSARAVVVSESLAQTLWPGADAVGRTLAVSEKYWSTREHPAPEGAFRDCEVIGVARDLTMPVEEFNRQAIYLPFALDRGTAGLVFLRPRTRTAGTLNEIVQAAEAAGVRVRFDRQLSMQLEIVVLPFYVFAVLSGTLGGMALGMALVGLHGLMSFAVSQRVREIGVRVALGATMENIVGLFVRQGMTLVAIGLALGLVGGWLCALLLKVVLYGSVNAFDAGVYAAVAALFAGVALAACWLPARRAARVDPMVALRTE